MSLKHLQVIWDSVVTAGLINNQWLQQMFRMTNTGVEDGCVQVKLWLVSWIYTETISHQVESWLVSLLVGFIG